MTDGVGTSGKGIGGAIDARSVYQGPQASELRARALYLEQTQSHEEKSGLSRLSRFLATGRDFDKNTPRGFHLNIRV
ncbi:MAG: hypothetical protein O2944_01815 [Proteobacteria bacterium]|nr:hypothetical protein [Pseudomonadota bacterium]